MAAIKKNDRYRRKNMHGLGVYTVVGVQSKTVSLRDPKGIVTVVTFTTLTANYDKEK